MGIIDDIRSKSAQMQNSQTILKAFGENETLEKGGKEKPEGTIYTRPDGRKFIKRGGKWVYHRESKGSVKIEVPSENDKRKEEMQNKRDREERSKMLSEKEKQTSKKEPEKSEKDQEILKLLREYKGKEAWSLVKKNGLFKGKWEQIPSDYNPNKKEWGVKLEDGSKLILKLSASTDYKSAGKGSRLRDPSGTKYSSIVKLIHKKGDQFLANERLISFGYRGENDYKYQEYTEKQEKYIKILNEATGLNLSRYSFSYT